VHILPCNDGKAQTRDCGCNITLLARLSATRPGATLASAVAAFVTRPAASIALEPCVLTLRLLCAPAGAPPPGACPAGCGGSAACGARSAGRAASPATDLIASPGACARKLAACPTQSGMMPSTSTTGRAGRLSGPLPSPATPASGETADVVGRGRAAAPRDQSGISPSMRPKISLSSRRSLSSQQSPPSVLPARNILRAMAAMTRKIHSKMALHANAGPLRPTTVETSTVSCFF
jgi:hypothetical protein